MDTKARLLRGLIKQSLMLLLLNVYDVSIWHDFDKKSISFSPKKWFHMEHMTQNHHSINPPPHHSGSDSPNQMTTTLLKMEWDHQKILNMFTSLYIMLVHQFVCHGNNILKNHPIGMATLKNKISLTLLHMTIHFIFKTERNEYLTQLAKCTFSPVPGMLVWENDDNVLSDWDSISRV